MSPNDDTSYLERVYQEWHPKQIDRIPLERVRRVIWGCCTECGAGMQPEFVVVVPFLGGPAVGRALTLACSAHVEHLQTRPRYGWDAPPC